MINRISISLYMILKMLFRRRIVIISLVVIPLVFFSVVNLTASGKIILFRLASINGQVFLEERQKFVSLIFFSCTATGFLVSFLGLNLMQIENEVNRRLVLSGYHPVELLVAQFLTLLLVIFFMAIYIGLLIYSFVPVKHPFLYISGLSLMGYVYGCYGLTIGCFIKGKLEGVFFIVLLANLDVGWLQNPMYYAEAQNSVIIRYLPAYYPSQAAIISAFTDYNANHAVLRSLAYGSFFMILSMITFFNKMRIRK